MKKATVLTAVLFFSVNAGAQKTIMDYHADADYLVSQMKLEEKALLLSGDGWWHTHGIERLNIPVMTVSDGPNGLRKAQGGSLGKSIPATCFPTASALASSWNPELAQDVGSAIGEEAQANDVQILLGPGTNMKRSPLGGRNFEYFSEDPILAGKMASGFIKGVQSQGVGTSLKHFAVNNQEFERMSMSSDVDERTLHEIYLPAFEIAVKEAQPLSVMCSYNRINGVYASENQELLDTILRKRWGYQGFVVSDWAAVNDRVKGLNAGLNLEMPGSGDYNRNKIIQAVKDGQISKKQLDEMTTGLLAAILKSKAAHKPNVIFDVDKHHDLARRVAGESIVLLKNSAHLLPLHFQKGKKIAIIGNFAKSPRYQGAGSSQVNPTKISNAYDELVKIAGQDSKLSFAQGYDEEGATTNAFLKEAQLNARAADVAIIFVGLPDSYESEGFDRANMSLPQGHNDLIKAVQKVQSKSVVVLMNGSAVSMPWVSSVSTIVEGWLTGQAGGGAIADVLSGQVNPSGKLSETFPVHLEDTPTAGKFPARGGVANYFENLFIGYRHYDKNGIKPLFPFGYGLSYTTFTYHDLKVSEVTPHSPDGINVTVRIKNTGKVLGKEVAQLYVREKNPDVVKPEKELKAFSKVEIKPGEEKIVTFSLHRRDFAYYDVSLHDWTVRSGDFDILVGSSSGDLPLHQMVSIDGGPKVYPPLTRDSMLKDFRDNPRGKEFYTQLLKALTFEDDKAAALLPKRELTEQERIAKKKGELSSNAFYNEMPVSKIMAMTEGRFTEAMLNAILEKVK